MGGNFERKRKMRITMKKKENDTGYPGRKRSRELVAQMLLPKMRKKKSILCSISFVPKVLFGRLLFFFFFYVFCIIFVISFD